jgi:ubiquitin fusion degradation protein 1
MMRNMLLEEASLITVESVSLPVATFSKFQPQSSDFLDISNPKAVLENALRHFACLTTGDIISIIYNSKVYELQVLETKPGGAVSIIECDMNVNRDKLIYHCQGAKKFVFGLRLILMPLLATKSLE